MSAPLLIGTHFYQGGPEEMRRQARVMDALAQIEGIAIVDLQWVDQPAKRTWIRTLPALRQSSTTVTGHAGRVKPLVREMFDALAAAAERIGSRHFVFFNADCLLTNRAIELLRAGRHQIFMLSRTNVDAAGNDLGIYAKGIDALACDVEWWRGNRQRFGSYIIGERSWDNVYGAIAMCHGDGVLLNREALLLHEAHPIVWGTGPFDVYNRFLTALDFRYFRMWGEYYDRLLDARSRGADENEERAIAREVFTWQPSGREAIVQVARSVKARVRYRRARRVWQSYDPASASATSVLQG